MVQTQHLDWKHIDALGALWVFLAWKNGISRKGIE